MHPPMSPPSSASGRSGGSDYQALASLKDTEQHSCRRCSQSQTRDGHLGTNARAMPRRRSLGRRSRPR
eukprot:868966-Pyramimonas_sp.AAC.1